MPVSLALYQPDIPQNAGTLLRLCACLDVPVHLIHPLGFTFSARTFRRSAMDYANHVTLFEHDSFRNFEDWRHENRARLVLMSTRSATSAYEFRYDDNDILMAGRESAGVPDDVFRQCDASVRIPMRRHLRSLNVAVASAMVLGEALKDTSFFRGLG